MARFAYLHNLTVRRDGRSGLPRNPLRPTYRIELVIREAGRLAPSPDHRSILAGQEPARPGVDIHYLVESSDPAFRDAALDILTREIHAALKGGRRP